MHEALKNLTDQAKMLDDNMKKMENELGLHLSKLNDEQQDYFKKVLKRAKSGDFNQESIMNELKDKGFL